MEDTEDTEKDTTLVLEIGDEGGQDSCSWCEFDTTPEGVDSATGWTSWTSASDDHFGNEYTYSCEMCEGSISYGIIHAVRGINPPTKKRLAHMKQIIKENAEERD